MLKFLMFFFAMLVGLGFVRLVNAVAAYMKNRKIVRLYWVHASWVLFMMLLYVNIWWALWGYRDVETWNYFSYLLLLAGPMSLFLATSLLVPEIDLKSGEDEDPIDTESFYYQISRGYFGALTAVALWGLTLHPVLTGEPDPAWPAIAAILACCATLAGTRNRRVHAAGAVGIWILFLALVISSGVSLAQT